MAKNNVYPIDYIKGLGQNEKLIVQKSLPLFSLWKSDLTLSEFKILDTYLGRINSYDDTKREVIFEKGEIEKILGVDRIRQEELEKRLLHLMGNVVKVADLEEDDGFTLVTLFEEARAKKDEFGMWQIKLECTQKAKKYFFNVDNLGYLRYKLRCITNLSSRYSYILFMYLEQNKFRKTWEVQLQDLKNILNCTADRYKEFKFFRKEVLERAKIELEERSNYKFSYETVKKGRYVVAIRFSFKDEDLNEMEVEISEITKNQMEIKDIIDIVSQHTDGESIQEKRIKRNSICKGFDDAVFDGLSDTDLLYLKELAIPMKEQADIDKHMDLLNDMRSAYEYAIADYLIRKIQNAKRYNPKNLVAYIETMIENEKNNNSSR